MARNRKLIGFTFTDEQRERQALRDVVIQTGRDPKTLSYVPDERTKTARVVDAVTGEVFGIYS